MVDTAVVGQYQGPQGTAALAVVAPCWNLIYSLGLLLGAGGGVIFSTCRGGGTGDGSENQYFTASVIGAAVLAVLTWLGIWCFETPVLTFFGADAELLPLAQTYLKPVKIVFPLFLVNEMLMFFLQTDGNPGRATLAILSGGIFNIFGDIFFVFGCDMGIFGAGLATAIGRSHFHLRDADPFSQPEKYPLSGEAHPSASQASGSFRHRIFHFLCGYGHGHSHGAL